ncbi:MAG TPA: DUF2809 domain-containing protein [Polyangia bacterium]|nr:DUF2809 domain-containing protein [Polyangia bacterium]
MPNPAPGAQRRLWRLDPRYLAAALVLFLVEVCIALFVHDAWLRPRGGDVLVVIFLYALVRGFRDLPVVPTALGVLAFSFAVEFLQYLHFVDRLGLGRSRVARVVLGSSFEWLDLLCYTLGIVVVLLYEWKRQAPRQQSLPSV